MEETSWNAASDAVEALPEPTLRMSQWRLGRVVGRGDGVFGPPDQMEMRNQLDVFDGGE